MIMPEYSYDIDSGGHIRTLAGCHAWKPTGATLIDGVQTTATWFGPFQLPERDLIRIATAVLDVDRLSPRRLAATRGIVRDLTWQRAIRIRIALEDPSRWQSAAPTLQKLLNFMTDDVWAFCFEGTPRVATQQVLFHSDEDPPTNVALFSGGLDSAAGLYARSVAQGGRYVAVSACGSDVRGKAQADALGRLRTLGVSCNWVKLVHQLHMTRRSRNQMEASQRSRGLLFLAMGA
jgi:hypothetical protein